MCGWMDGLKAILRIAHSNQQIVINRPEQLLLHDCVSVSFPVQLLPPKAGKGLLHTRLRVFIPSLQVTLQAPKEDHSPQFPLTELKQQWTKTVILVQTETIKYQL